MSSIPMQKTIFESVTGKRALLFYSLSLFNVSFPSVLIFFFFFPSFFFLCDESPPFPSSSCDAVNSDQLAKASKHARNEKENGLMAYLRSLLLSSFPPPLNPETKKTEASGPRRPPGPQGPRGRHGYIPPGGVK